MTTIAAAITTPEGFFRATKTHDNQPLVPTEKEETNNDKTKHLPNPS